jgi:ribosome maturation factor RimP
MQLESLREVSEKSAEELGLFVLEIKSRPGNVFSIYVDGDEPVTLAQLGKLNRAIDDAFDRELEDYSLEVSSPGASSPLHFPRQYHKHVGHPFQVELVDGQKWKGELAEVSDEGVSLRWKERVPKEIGKGKQTVERTIHVRFEEIAKAKRTVNFNK